MKKPETRQFETDTPDQTGGVYTWTFAGAPIRINVRLDVILKLQAATSPLPNHARPPFGGLLLGRAQPPITIEIDDFVPIPAAPQPSSRYVPNLAELERVLREKGPSGDGGPRPSVIGYFRSQQDQSLALRADEVEFVKKYFHEPTQVVLLIETSSEPGTAGFLFWDGDDLVPFSLMDFPLDAAALKLHEAARAAEAEEYWPSLEAGTEPAEVPLGADGKLVRTGRPLMIGGAAALLLVAGVAGFASRGHWPAAPSSQSAAAQPVSSALQLEVEAVGSGLNLRWNPQAAPMAQASGGRLVVTGSGRPQQVVDLDADQLKSGHVFYSSSAEQVQFRLEVMGGAGLIAKESILVLNSSAPADAAPASATPGNGAPAARKLKTIPVIEAPLSAPAPGADAEDVAFSGTTKGDPGPTIVSSNSAAPGAASDDDNPAPNGSRRPARAFQVAVQRLPPTPVQPLAEPPSLPVVHSGGTLPVPDFENPLLARPPEVVPPKPVASAPSPAPAPAPAITTPGAAAPSVAPSPAARSYVLPVPVKQPIPTLTSDMRAALNFAGGNVDIAVRVAIDESGKVTKAELVDTSTSINAQKAGYLRAAALGAARQWQFKPGVLNGKNIASEYVIEFKFR
jgi:hypothetical protein